MTIFRSRWNVVPEAGYEPARLLAGGTIKKLVSRARYPHNDRQVDWEFPVGV
jgi:hypothetical protein